MTTAARDDSFAALAVAEAIAALELVKAEALPDLVKALPDFMSDPGYLLGWRKLGTQLTDYEKRQLGMSARAFMSKELLVHLTPLGMRDPTNAHAVTLQRASHSLSRAVSLQGLLDSAMQMEARRICPETAGCDDPQDWTDPAALDPLPPAHCRDCLYRTCRSVFVFRRKGRRTTIVANG